MASSSPQKRASGPISFQAVLERSAGPVGMLHILRFPYSVHDLFGTRGYFRVIGSVNGVPVQRTLQPNGDGTHYLIINKRMRSEAGIEEGEEVTVVIEPDGEPEELELPEELAVVLDMDEDARARYERQTPATRRSMIQWIDSAKRPETRERRAVDLLGRLQSKDLIFGGSKGKE